MLIAVLLTLPVLLVACNSYSLAAGFHDGEQLRREKFSSVKCVIREDGLEINEVQPLVDFTASSSIYQTFSQTEHRILADYLEAKLISENKLRVKKHRIINSAEITLQSKIINLQLTRASLDHHFPVLPSQMEGAMLNLPRLTIN